MINCKRSVAVGDPGSLDRLPDAVVVPDRGGEGEDALEHADEHAGRGMAAVAFEVELALKGLVDRLDDLPQRLEEVRAASKWAGGSGGRRLADEEDGGVSGVTREPG